MMESEASFRLKCSEGLRIKCARIQNRQRHARERESCGEWVCSWRLAKRITPSQAHSRLLRVRPAANAMLLLAESRVATAMALQ